ncbi:hypothetical protein J6590_007381 [Homalodisca vitripennis]|nr:hypothetical protein J6590_007381 [Homalodisca vitripennis]
MNPGPVLRWTKPVLTSLFVPVRKPPDSICGPSVTQRKKAPFSGAAPFGFCRRLRNQLILDITTTLVPPLPHPH